MASKQDILNNTREYNSDQLAEAIKSGVVTMYELSKSGNLTPLMRKRIETKLAETPVIDNIPEIAESATSEASQTPAQTDSVESEQEEISVAQIPEAAIPEAVIPEADIPEAQIQEFAVATDVQEAPSVSTQESTEDVLDNKGMFKRPFSFHGRIRRLEYGLSMIIVFFYAMLINGIMESITNSSSDAGGALILILILYIPFYWFVWAQNCKRCHDLGNSGWWQLIPFYGFWLLFASGDESDNEYGNNPKD